MLASMTEWMEKLVGQEVQVETKTNNVFKGILKSVDDQMNVELDDVHLTKSSFLSNSRQKLHLTKRRPRSQAGMLDRRYDHMLIKGSKILSVVLPDDLDCDKLLSSHFCSISLSTSSSGFSQSKQGFASIDSFVQKPEKREQLNYDNDVGEDWMPLMAMVVPALEKLIGSVVSFKCKSGRIMTGTLAHVDHSDTLKLKLTNVWDAWDTGPNSIPHPQAVIEMEMSDIANLNLHNGGGSFEQSFKSEMLKQVKTAQTSAATGSKSSSEKELRLPLMKAVNISSVME